MVKKQNLILMMGDKMFSFQVDLTKDKILKAILIFAIPIFISNILIFKVY